MAESSSCGYVPSKDSSTQREGNVTDVIPEAVGTVTLAESLGGLDFTECRFSMLESLQQGTGGAFLNPWLLEQDPQGRNSDKDSACHRRSDGFTYVCLGQLKGLESIC